MEKNIGQQLRDARNSANLSQSQLAEKSIISKDTISALETNRKKDVHTSILRKLGKILNYTFQI